MSLDIGGTLPEFSLIANDGLIYTMKQFRGYRALIIFFTKSDSLYTRNGLHYIEDLAKRYYSKGCKFIQISIDNEETYISDSLIQLFDRTGDVMKRFLPETTMEFFLFDQGRFLVYRGRSLDNLEFPEKAKSDALKTALDELLDSRSIEFPRTSPIGDELKEAIFA